MFCLSVAAFYAELAAKKISVNGHIWTKSKFLGLAVCAQMVGEGELTVSLFLLYYMCWYYCTFMNFSNVPAMLKVAVKNETFCWVCHWPKTGKGLYTKL